MIPPQFQYGIYKQQERELLEKLEYQRKIAEAESLRGPRENWFSGLLRGIQKYFQPEKARPDSCYPAVDPACTCQ
jgi:hypothetical protein